MKKLFIVSLFAIAGCSTVNKIVKNKDKYRKEHYSVQHNVVYFDGKPFAELQAMTWSLDGGELVREMNFKLLDKSRDFQTIGDMIDFLSDRHNGDEIEVEFNVEEGSDDFKL